MEEVWLYELGEWERGPRLAWREEMSKLPAGRIFLGPIPGLEE
jgi:hypothetical protein